MIKNVLTIAGSDSGGGAGIQADLKTFSALETYGLSVITAVTAQNTQGVYGIDKVDVDIIEKQIDVVFTDFDIAAVKIGMVFSEDIIKTIVKSIKKWNIKKLVLDPVMISESGSHLLQRSARKTLLKRLLPLADIITPNIHEAQAIVSRKIEIIEDMKKAAKEIYDMGSGSVLIKGGHLKGGAVDILYDGKNIEKYESVRIKTQNTHGTGCTYSSAIAAFIAKGYSLKDAVRKAKLYITGAIKNSHDIGKGPGPTHHFYKFY